MANKKIISKNKKFNVNQPRKIKTRLGNRTNVSTIKDARLKIIKKKRNNVVDARDILAKMAKTQDARNKIEKLRETKIGINVSNSTMQPIGSNIFKKTDRNGKISLVTNKPKQSTDINLAIQKQLGLLTPSRNTVQRSLKTTIKTRTAPPPVIRKTIQNDHYPIHIYNRNFDDDLYKWVRPISRPSAELLSNRLELREPLEMRNRLELREPLEMRIRNANISDWKSYPSLQSSRALRLPNTYVDLDAVDDEEMPLAPPVNETISLQGLARSSNVHSRLDNNPVQQQTHGILSQTKTKVVVPAGHRIVVSNLQATVTQDDIKELFEDIGQLLVARLVRPGTAEVIYKNLKDAQKAVDTYHNRQLDGQPMKCFLVNKRPVNNPTAPALLKPASEGILSVNRKSTSASSSNKLVPDLGIVHKVLFKRK